MDERGITTGVIPLRHSSLPGHVKLPRRYEKAAMGTNGIPTRLRKISIQPGHCSLGDSLSDRLDDLMAAIMWVKQELIMLRQHDILLKRQFFDIQHSIRSLQKPKAAPSTTSSELIPTTILSGPNTVPSVSLPKGNSLLEEENWEVHGGKQGERDVFSHNDFLLGTYVVRPSSSVTMLYEESDEDEDIDTFVEEFFYRPRTSSMRTSRDMAALARRRGSKELI